MAVLAKQTDKQAEKRKRIIASSAKIFAKSGFHVSTIQEIADHAGIGKGTVYEYFASKDDLFLTVYDEWMHHFEEAMQAALSATSDPLTQADTLIETAIKFYEDRADDAPLLLEFWAHALRTDNPAFLERIQATKSRVSALGAQITKKLIALKAFTKVDVASFALLEMGISDGIFLHWVLDKQAYSLRSAYKFRQSVIGAGLMTPALRLALSSKISKKLKQGFLNDDVSPAR
jgi:AcrR family transcriptional regulator